MADQMLKTRIIHKHETEADWNKATNFIPLLGELIVYDSDSNYPYARIKIGDGETVVTELPFVGSSEDVSIELDTTLTQSGVAADAKAVGDRLIAMDVATKQYVDSQLNNFMTAEEIKAYIDSYINTTMASKEW